MFGFGGPKVKTLTPREAAARAAAGEVLLVDVREPNEWAAGHIAGAAHAPMSRLAEAAAKLPTDRPVVFYCATGMRSARAVTLCKRLGLAHDTHMGGGIAAWAREGLPIER
jgi:rhodanese-related sulfurtransferase